MGDMQAHTLDTLAGHGTPVPALLVLESTEFSISVERRWKLSDAPEVECYINGGQLFQPGDLLLHWSKSPGRRLGREHFSGWAWPALDHQGRFTSAHWDSYTPVGDERSYGIAPDWVADIGEQLYTDLHDLEKTTLDLPFGLSESYSAVGLTIDETWSFEGLIPEVPGTVPPSEDEKLSLRVSWIVQFDHPDEEGRARARYRAELRIPDERTLADWGGVENPWGTTYDDAIPGWVQEVLNAALDRVMAQPLPVIRTAAEFITGSGS